jgi:hypothetical protein
LKISFALLGRYLSETDEVVGEIVGSNLSFANLRATILSLHRHTFDNDAHLGALRDLLARAGRIEEERNRIVHSIWGADENGVTVTRIKVTAREKHGHRTDSEEYDDDRLAEFARQIRSLTGETVDFDPWDDESRGR